MFPLCGPLQWIILAIFFAWRIGVCRKDKEHIAKHIVVSILLCPFVIFLTNMAHLYYYYP